ncbi:MAG: gamma-glutamyl-gamma-aminobutyrate hydrolase family protein [Candidatus Absconditicoccaceae bacterium]
MINILVVDNESLHTNQISDLFPGKNITFCKYNEIPDTKKYDLIVLSGSSHYSVLHKPSHYKKEISLIKNTNIPILGICLGCQLIAHTFGSTLTQMSEKLVKEIEIRNNLDEKDYKVFEAHKYAITKLGEEIKGISKSKYGYEIIHHKTKPLWGFQFHPEVDMEHTQGRKILKEVMDIIF